MTSAYKNVLKTVTAVVPVEVEGLPMVVPHRSSLAVSTVSVKPASATRTLTAAVIPGMKCVWVNARTAEDAENKPMALQMAALQQMVPDVMAVHARNVHVL